MSGPIEICNMCDDLGSAPYDVWVCITPKECLYKTESTEHKEN